MHSLVRASRLVGECGLFKAGFALRLPGSAFTPCNPVCISPECLACSVSTLASAASTPKVMSICFMCYTKLPFVVPHMSRPSKRAMHDQPKVLRCLTMSLMNLFLSPALSNSAVSHLLAPKVSWLAGSSGSGFLAHRSFFFCSSVIGACGPAVPIMLLTASAQHLFFTSAACYFR